MYLQRIRQSCCALLLLGLATASAAFGADAPVLRKNSFELGGFYGASYGVDEFRNMGGVNATYSLTRIILPYVEYSYFPGIGRKQTGVIGGTTNPYTLTYAVPLSDFHGGVHIRFIIKEKPIVPYAVFGLGALKSFDATTSATIRDSNNVVQTIDLPYKGSADFAFNFGGGIRYYRTPRYGFRVEAKVYRLPGSAFKDNPTFSKVEAGFFIQLH